MLKRMWLVLCLGILGLAIPLYAEYPDYYTEEYISFYDVTVEVQTNRSIIITEDIRVKAANLQINRGIYRDIPLYGRGPLRLSRRYPVKLLQVLKDGQPEPWHTESQEQGLRVYIGQENVYLDPGFYQYRLVYQVDEALSVNSNHAELYWNVIGDQWSFPIRDVRVVVHLPRGGGRSILYNQAWHGRSGDTNQNYTMSTSGDYITYILEEELGVSRGMTIKVQWVDKSIAVMSSSEQTWKLIKDNRGVFFLLGGVVVILLYYLVTWALLGRDPAKGSITTWFDAPEGLSPGALRYIQRMGNDHKIFTSLIIHLAVRGYLKIEEKDDKYELIRLNNSLAGLADEEQEIVRELFRGSDKIEVESSNHTTFSEAMRKCHVSLKKQYEKTYFITNRHIFIPGLILSIAIMITGFALDSDSFMSIFMMIWLSIWNMGVFFLLKAVGQSWKAARSRPRRSFWDYLGALFFTFFASFFVIGDIFGFVMFLSFVPSSVWIIPIALVVVGLNRIFFHLLKAPTLAGRRLMDQIEGFKRYLNVAEKDRMEFFNPPSRDIQTFEKFLAYALAFDIEQNWAGYFNTIMDTARAGGAEYHPSWYSGRSLSGMDFSSFAGSLGTTLSSALSSASVSPSSGGSGGGGSSGGGGGGGGGGGW